MSLRIAPVHRPAPAAVGLAAVPAAVLAATLLVSGCGAGQKAQTYQGKAFADATNGAIGSIAVRNLAVLGPRQGTVLRQGADARAMVTLVNDGAEPDELISATSPAATAVRVAGPSTRLEVPGLGRADPGYSLVLTDLTKDLPSGTYVDMTLSFRRNGSKTLMVPIQIVPENLDRPESDYEVAETDSAGKPIVKPSESAAAAQ